jgi:hypothetical protein
MPGPSGYVTAFTHPDPMDPNDRLRQQTQSRSDDFPYDRPVMYGRSTHAGMDGDERQDGADDGPPPGDEHEPDRPLSVWDRISDSIDRMEQGPQAADAFALGYGNHGRMGEDGMDAIDLEIDALQKDFRSSYDDARPTTDEMHPHDLFVLLTQMDPDFSAETFAPEDEDEMRSIYTLWADRMSGLEG